VSGWLVDTNVISAFAPSRPERPQAAAWLEARSDDLFLSAIAAAEIEAGVAKLRREGGGRRAQSLAGWLDEILGQYGERVLPLDVEAARIAGRLIDAARARGHTAGFADAAVAGIAKAHGLTVLTVNLRHFHSLGVDAVEPFAPG
jgi:predicted nucleic acid-binding protein